MFGMISQAFEAEEKTRLSGKGASGNRQLRQTQSASTIFKDVQDDTGKESFFFFFLSMIETSSNNSSLYQATKI